MKNAVNVVNSSPGYILDRPVEGPLTKIFLMIFLLIWMILEKEMFLFFSSKEID